MATKHRHAETFPPGEFIRDEMDARQWTQIDLADVLGVSVSHVNELLNARVNITADIAKGLDAAFGMTPEFWANLDSQYRLAQVGENAVDAVTRVQAQVEGVQHEAGARRGDGCRGRGSSRRRTPS